MIHYQLRCAGEHEFDGWFKDSAGFERQASRGLVACPVCADAKVSRALMAPGIRAKSEPKHVAVRPKAGGVIPDNVRAALTQLRVEVEKNCDYVGGEFAAEARRIHYGEADARGIYGESSEAEAEALADEGIEIAQIPWLPRADG